MNEPEIFSRALEKLQDRLNYLNTTGRVRWQDMPLLDDFRGIPWGTLWNIAHGRDPQDPVLRARLGLPPHLTCGQCWRFNKFIKQAIPKKATRWDQLSDRELRFALEHREGLKE